MSKLEVGTRVRVLHKTYAGLAGAIEEINEQQTDGCAYFVRFDKPARNYVEPRVDKPARNYVEPRVDIMRAGSLSGATIIMDRAADFYEDLSTPLPRSGWFKANELLVILDEDDEGALMTPAKE